MFEVSSMVGAISGVNSYFPVYGSYQMPLNAARNTGEAAQAAQRGQQAGGDGQQFYDADYKVVDDDAKNK